MSTTNLNQCELCAEAEVESTKRVNTCSGTPTGRAARVGCALAELCMAGGAGVHRGEASIVALGKDAQETVGNLLRACVHPDVVNQGTFLRSK